MHAMACIVWNNQKPPPLVKPKGVEKEVIYLPYNNMQTYTLHSITALYSYFLKSQVTQW